MIAVDLDGCLATYHGWKNGEIGDPVPAMLDRVKDWISRGYHVCIFTARVGVAPGLRSIESNSEASEDFCTEQKRLIEAWCLEHLGVVLPVTATKTFDIVEIWDDRAVAVEPNTGRILGRGR